eukprot:SAG11_NODE_6153_length_1375_cov_39.965517_1_plen_457_part_11
MELGRVLASEVTSLKVPVMGGSVSGASGSYTLCAGVGQLDLSEKQLGPADLDVLAATLMYGRTLLAGVTAVDLSQNELLWSAGCGRLAELVAGLEQTGVWELDLSGTGLGAAGTVALAEVLRSPSAPSPGSRISASRSTGGQLRLLTVSVTGGPPGPGPGEPKIFTLSVDNDEVDLSEKQLGPADAQLLAAAMLSTQLMRSVRCLNVLRNPGLGLEGMQTLVSAVEQNSSVVSLIGVVEGQREVDLSFAELDASDVRLIVAEMELGRVLASEVTSLKVPVMGGSVSGASGSYTLSVDSDQLDLSERQLGPADAQLLAAAMLSTQLMRSVRCLNVLRNPGLKSMGMQTLVSAVEHTPSVVSLIGVVEGQREVDLSDAELDASDVRLMVADMELGRVLASEVTLVTMLVCGCSSSERSTVRTLSAEADADADNKLSVSMLRLIAATAVSPVNRAISLRW